MLLQPSCKELQARLQRRAASSSHFFPASLLDSQLAALEWRRRGGDEDGEQEEPWGLVAPDSGGVMFPAPEAIADALAERVRVELLLLASSS